jgi:hypothetical protein
MEGQVFCLCRKKLQKWISFGVVKVLAKTANVIFFTSYIIFGLTILIRKTPNVNTSLTKAKAR